MSPAPLADERRRATVGRVRGWRHSRWLVVGIGVLVLCLLPAIAAARPAPRVRVDAHVLRDRILASTAQPYQGYAESTGDLHLPSLPQLSDVIGLLGGTTTTRSWYSSQRAWRVAILEQTGERDI